MAETFSKKENREKRAKKKQEKAQRIEERRVNNDRGKGLDEMMAYVDENGNLTTVRPLATKRVEIDPNDILLGAAPIEAEEVRKKGSVSFFSDKGYGFIIETKSRNKVFFHKNELLEHVVEGDKVTFEVENTARGTNAIRVEKDK
jgi:CspA family cold shock protein